MRTSSVTLASFAPYPSSAASGGGHSTSQLSSFPTAPPAPAPTGTTGMPSAAATRATNSA